MRHESKTFGELQVGEHFWSFEGDVGDKEIEKIKTYFGQAKWADGEPDNTYFYPTDYEVWVAVYDGWPKYLIWICIAISNLLAFAFGWLTANILKGL